MMFKVHRVLEGPREDMDDIGTYWLLCSIEDVEDQEMFTDEIPFISFDAAYKFKQHFEKSIDPITIDFEVESRLN